MMGSPKLLRDATDGHVRTILFVRPIPCGKCGAALRSGQTEAFECTLDESTPASGIDCTGPGEPLVDDAVLNLLTAILSEKLPGRLT
jgi:hypothetical protein